MILDKKRIAHLRELELETGEEIISALTQLFKRDSPAFVENLRQHLVAGEYLQAGKVAHKIKTTCANLGITAGYEICLELETQCKKMNRQFRYTSHIKKLENIILTSMKELARELKSAS